MMDLSGNNVFITGATGDIGQAIARQMHKLGAFVYISGSDASKLEQLGNSLGARYAIKRCDLRDHSACDRLFDDIEKIDVLVYNAGINRDNLVIKMSNDDFDEVMNINLKAAFILNKAVIKKMIRARYGRIINMSSVVGVAGNPGQANYCASKAGLIGMTKALALEVASRGITINNIAPGFIKSHMTAALTDSQKDAIMQRIPAKNFGTPEDIAYTACFLASPSAAYITGQTIHVNGGMLLI